MRRLPLLRLVAVICISSVGLWHATPATAQSGAEGLLGRVVHGTTSAPVPSVMVELHRVTQDGGGLIDSVRVGPDGAFSFDLEADGSPDDASTVWIAAARYEGILYFGAPIHAGMATEDGYEITVYDTVVVAEPVEGLVTALRHVVLAAIPDHGGVIQVAEIVDISHEGTESYVGADSATVVWQMPLPTGAVQGSVIEGGLPAEAVVFDAGRVGITGTLPPPGARLAIQYVVPAERFEIEVTHPTRNLDVLADQGGGALEVSGLQSVAAPQVPGSTILRFAGADMAPGTRISIRTVPPVAPSGTLPWIWLVVGVVLLAAAAAATRLRPGEAGP